MAEAIICASCPEACHDRVAEVCRRRGIQKAFGKAGDMLNALSGKDWVPKWEAKVVMATVTKAQTMGVGKGLILCIAGGKNCDAEMARQPQLVRAIKQEIGDPNFRVRVEWVEVKEFFERYDTEATAGAMGSEGSTGKGRGKVDSSAGKTDSAGKTNSSAGRGKGKSDSPADKMDSPAVKTDSSDGKGKGKVDSPAGKTDSSPVKTDSSAGKGKGGAKSKGAAQPGAALVEQKGSKAKSAPAPEAATKEGAAAAGGKASKAAPLCSFFAKGNCRNGSACTFSHRVGASSGKEPEGPNAFGKTLCRHFKKGACINGSACPYVHKVEEGVAKQVKDPKTGGKDKSRKVRCNECGRSFKDWDHVRAKHWFCQGHEPLCMCLQCGKKFDGEVECGQHQRATRHEGVARVNDPEPPTWNCQECGQAFQSSEACEQHMRAVGHGNVFGCGSCDRLFQSVKALLNHQSATGHQGMESLNQSGSSSDSEPESISHTCECGRSFGSETAFMQHTSATGHLVTGHLGFPMIGPFGLI